MTILGYNATIFAYGQTGAGKTYTIQGPPELSGSNALSQSSKRGILSRVFDSIFVFTNSLSQSKQGDEELTFLVKCHYLEIYNERLIDLLEPANKSPQIREGLKIGTYVEGVQEETVKSSRDLMERLSRGFLHFYFRCKQ